MKKSTLQIISAFILCTIAGNAVAQEACSDEMKTALETCITDATTACKAQYPGCEPSTTLTVEAALTMLAEKCSCAESKNFGRFNSCMKRFRNGLRALGSLTPEISAALEAARAECKGTKTHPKKGEEEGEA